MKRTSLLIILILSLTSQPNIADESNQNFHAAELLGRPSDSSVCIEVIPALDMKLYAEYGKKAGKLKKSTSIQKVKSGETVEITIGGLKRGRKYYYRLLFKPTGSQDYLSGEVNSFRTQCKPNKSFDFVVISDSHLDMAPNQTKFSDVLQYVETAAPDFIIDLGDTFMTDRLESFAASAVSGRMLLVRELYASVCHSIPLYLALGNHAGEIGCAREAGRKNLAITASNLRKQYFPNPSPDDFYSGNSVSENQVGLRENYYSWTWGSALFVVLDPHWYNKAIPMRTKDNWDRSLGAEQHAWLEATLKDSNATFKFIFTHNLVGGLDNYARGGKEAVDLYEWGGQNQDDSYGFPSQRPGWTAPIHQLLKKYNVTIVFHGHDHSYACQEKDGIIYQLCPQPSNSPKTDFAEALDYGYKEGVILDGAGYLRVRVTKSYTKVEFIQTDANSNSDNGKVLYSYRIEK